MSTAELLNWALGLSGIILSAFIRIILGRIKEMSDKHEKLKDNHYDLISNLSNRYVGKTDFQYIIDNLFTKLDRIDEKLDRKSDKKP